MEETKCVAHSDDILTSFERWRRDGKFCDFTLKIGDEEMQVHRNVLAAASKYFDAMFSHDTEEMKNGRVEMREIDPDSGKLCIDFIYTGKAMFSCENPRNLIHASELMQLHSLTDLYFQFLIKKISLENCMDLMDVAHTYSQHTFEEVFREFTVGNFEELLSSDAFLLLNGNLVCECLASLKNTGPGLEIAKWEAIKRWIEADKENRQSFFSAFFQSVKLEFLPDELIKEDISNYSLLRDSYESMQLAFDALCARNRPIHNIVDKAGQPCIITCHWDSRLMFRVNLEKRQWDRVGRIPKGMVEQCFDIVSSRGEIYVGSGAALYKFAAGKWRTLLETTFGRQANHCSAHHQSIYMATTSRTIEYNTRANSWVNIETGHRLGGECFATSSDDFIYAMDGNNAMEFDVKAKTWEPIASMGCERKRAAAVWFKGKVYVFGGYRSVRFGFNSADAKIPVETLEWYCRYTDVWTQIAAKSLCDRFNFKVFVINDTLYVVGGSEKNVIDVLDITKLEADKKMPLNIEGAHTCIA